MEKGYSCVVCSTHFTILKEFVEHMNTVHMQQDSAELLHCPSCSLSFDRTVSLREHMQFVHQSVPTFSIQAQPLKTQLQGFAKHGLVCNQCKNPFANKYSLMKHLRSTKCRLDNEASINRVINEQLTCSKCKHQFGSVQALKKHLDNLKCPTSVAQSSSGQTHNEAGRKRGLIFDEAIQLTPYATVPVFKCPDPLCGKACVTLRAFRMHAKCVHKDLSNNQTPLMEEAKANFICKVRGCGKLFVDEQQLDVHFKHHENYTPRSGKHKCHVCKEAFYQRDMLKRHLLSLHEEVTSFRGRKLKANNIDGDESTIVKAGYKRSMQSPNQLRYNANMTLSPGTLMTVYRCPIESCGKKSCTDTKSFKLHCMHIHQDKHLKPIVEQTEARYICQVENCGKLYLEKKQYDIHQRHHKTYVPSNGRYFKCLQCESKFNSQANLDVHAIQVHLNSEELGAKNDLIFDNNITLEPGTLMTVFHCPIEGCGKRNYLDSKSVRTHCRRCHAMVDFEASPSETEAQFICQVRGCKKLFVEAVQIEAHLKHHRNYIPTNGNFECKICPESFTRKELLDQHTLNFHTYNNLREQPNQVFQDGSKAKQTDLHPHKPKEKAFEVIGYQCSICMRKFLHLGTHCNHVTNAHQMPGLQPVEVEIKPRYTCKHPRCGNKHFMTKNMYVAHMNRHNIGKDLEEQKQPLHCHKCKRIFSQLKSLKKHLIQTHADVTVEEVEMIEAAHAKCSKCSSVFRNEDILKNHMVKKHQAK